MKPSGGSGVAPGFAFESVRPGIAKANGGEAFLAQWDGFMAQHGHHTRGEADVMNPRWSEMPDAVLDLVRGYLRGIGQADPVAVHRQRGIEREKLAEECRRRLRNPLKRWLFDFLLVRAQRGCAFRENLKSEAIRHLAVARRLLLALGERLAGRGFLACRDDIFFLRLDELEPVVQGAASFDVHAAIAERRAEHARNLALEPPSVVVGRFDPGRCLPDEVDEAAQTLTGVGVSAGVATGPARVILRSDAGERVLPGEILVAPFTDPGWTPYFLPAAGIVVDMGGQLSHGSIVAREYGIPAVVNVGPATKIIRTGQRVEVDGNRGIVRILGG
jgi:pyruvate,water dikinase